MTQSPKGLHRGLDALDMAENLLIAAKLCDVEGTMPLRQQIIDEKAARRDEWIADLREIGITIEPPKAPSAPPRKGWLKRLFGSN